MNSIRNLKILLLTAYMGFGIYIPFARLFFEASPLSGGQYGILMSIPGYILILSQPVWSLISDYTGSLRRNFQIMLLGSGLFLFVFFAARSFFLSNYIALLVLFGFFSIFRTGGEPIMNSLSLSFVEGTGENYGQVRLWSSVGWAVATVLGGYFFLRTSLEYLFPLSSAFFLVAALIAFPLEEPKRKTLRTMNVFKSREIKRALNNKKLWIFLIFIFLLWVGVSSADIFVPAYLERHFEFGLVGIGVFYAFQALAEVPFFYYGSEIMDELGVRFFLILGFGLFGLAWIIFGLVTASAMTFVVLSVRAVGFSFMTVGAVNYIDQVVTEETRTVGQSLFTVSTFGLGAIVGPTLGGFLSQMFELPILFLIGGSICFFATLGLVLFWSVT